MASNKKTLLIIIVTAIVTCLLTNITRDFIIISPNRETIRKVELVSNIIDKYYLNDVDKEKVSDYASMGMMAALDDPYSMYFNKESFKKYTDANKGIFVGIGVEISVNKDKNTIEIVSPYENSPAAKAGILPGDIIEKINGKSYNANNYSDAIEEMTGLEGEDVTITIRRGENQTFDVTMTREIIKTVKVIKNMLDNNIGYIRITEFDLEVDKEFANNIEELKSQGMQKLIIDLRNNPGGDFDVVCNIADSLLPSGVILYTEDKNNKTETKYSDDAELDMPIAVLVNEGSASASEVLAGALQSNGKAVLVGKRTYGKGVGQSVIPFTDGSGLKVTRFRFFLSNDICIQGIGLQPDFEVDNTSTTISQLPLIEDNQLLKAIDYLNNK